MERSPFDARLFIVAASVYLSLPSGEAALRAGVGRVNATLPTGVPLAGYSARKTKLWPLPVETKYTTFMEPSVGHLDTTWAKALVLDDGETKLCITTVDAIGADGTLMRFAYEKAAAKGFSVPQENVILSASHSHSGPGGVAGEFLWEFAPATDLLVPELQDQLAQHVADAMLQADRNLQPAQFGIHTSQLLNVTKNRRADISPYLEPTSIDPNFVIVRVDTASGTALATIWNFAIHGTCIGPSSLLSSGDIMGGVNADVETRVGGTAFFINADAGDIAPTSQTCAGLGRPTFYGAAVIGKFVESERKKISLTTDVKLTIASEIVQFGSTDLNLTLARVENCTKGGPLDICGICAFLNCDYHLHLDSAWVANAPRFTAVKFSMPQSVSGLVTVPGEALSGLGFEIRKDMAALGFEHAVLAGYSNEHMGYFATVQEYDVGGYESLLTFWGSGTAEKVRENCRNVADKVKASVNEL